MVNRNIAPNVRPVDFIFQKPQTKWLDNGIPVYFIQAGEQEVIRLDIVISAGQWNQSRLLQALFTNRLLREGTLHYSSKEIAEQLDFYGAWLELSVSMNHSFLTLYTLKKYFTGTLNLISSMLLEPTFPKEEFEVVRTTNRNQFLINAQKGDVKARRTLNRALYGNEHPCGRFAEEADFNSIRQEDIVDFFHQYYTVDRFTFYLSGKIDAKVMEEINSSFGKIAMNNSKVQDAPLYKVQPNGQKRIGLSQQDAVQCSIRMGTLLMDVKSPDYMKMRVLTTVLGGYFGSRLMKNIREDKGYTYHIGADLITNPDACLLIINSEALSGKGNAVIREVYREMRRLMEEKIPEAELNMVRNYMLGEICRNYEGPFSLTDAYIYIQTLGLPMDHIDRTIETIRSISAGELQDLAQKYLDPKKMKAVVVD